MAYAQIDAITRELFLPKLEDNILTNTQLLPFLFKDAEFHDGGRTIVVPVKYQTNGAGGSYGRGDLFTVTAPTTRTTFSFDWKQNYQSITLWGIDVAMSGGAEKVLDHVKTSMEEAESDFQDKLATQIFSDGTGNGGKNILGIQAVADDGSNVATYGGKTRSVDVWAKGGYQGSVGALTVAYLQQAYRGSASGNKKPNLIVTGEARFNSIENIILATQQSTVQTAIQAPFKTEGNLGLSASYGFTSLYFKGVPVIADEYCTATEIYFLNTSRLKMHILRNKMEKGSTKKMGISMTEMKKPVDQDGEVAQLLLYCELVCSEPRTQYRLAGVTS